jgi:dTDP-glucose 4,6-dehydratase
VHLLVTGGAGFIGSNLIGHIIDRPQIETLINVDCLTYAGHLENLTAVEKHPKYVFEKVDLRDKPALIATFKRHPITHIIHLAAESQVDRSISGPDAFIQTNIVGTFNLLETCRGTWKEGENRFLHVSTDEVFGSLGTSGAFKETTPYAPNSPYAASKAASDMLVRAYHRTYALPTLMTNCSNNYGPYQFPEKLIPVVIQCVLAKKPVPLFGDGLHVRDWLHVRDHAEALWRVLTRGRIGETYNIGGKTELPNLRVAEVICDIIDELAPTKGAPSRSLIRLVADRPGHDRRYANDTTKIERELDWTPSQAFESGLRETVRWYLENQAWVRAVQRQDR